VNKLVRLHPEDKIRGNYLLIMSGPVTHIPYSGDHLYLISEEQAHMLDVEEIRYSEFRKCEKCETNFRSKEWAIEHEKSCEGLSSAKVIECQEC